MDATTAFDVPLIDLKAEFEQLRYPLTDMFKLVGEYGNYVAGDQVAAFEREWAEYCGAKYCVGLSSATDALALTLAYFRREKPGLTYAHTTPMTFWATTEAILRAGLEPVFYDIEPKSGMPDYMAVPLVDIVVPVHLYGRPASTWPAGALVIEDAAHAHGHKLRGRAMCHSFYPTKNLGAMGQAGSVVTDDEDLADWVRMASNHGEDGGRFRHVLHNSSGNYRMDELQAALLRVKLTCLDQWNARRRVIAAQYWEGLRAVPGISCPEDASGHVYHIYAIRCARRDSLAAFLKSRGIQTAVRYPIPMYGQPALALGTWHLRGGTNRMILPEAEAWASETLSLPIYPQMPDWQVMKVCESVKTWARGA